jgi:NAD+ dependent glucose-6-phosphate dehydrogenase
MKKVLITGATGNIGRKLRAHLEANGKYALHLLCLSTGNDPTVHTVDLSTFDQDWTAKFAGVDTALHVAADPNPRAGRARRVVFASSNFVVGHRFGRGGQTTTMEPAPINPYGASKLFSERVGTMFAERYGVSLIAFRIGVCQRTNDNLHKPWIPFGRWGQAMWVSDRDLCRAFEHAIDDERISFGVFATSRASPIRASSWRIWAWRRPSSPAEGHGAKAVLPRLATVRHDECSSRLPGAIGSRRGLAASSCCGRKVWPNRSAIPRGRHRNDCAGGIANWRGQESHRPSSPPRLRANRQALSGQSPDRRSRHQRGWPLSAPPRSTVITVIQPTVAGQWNAQSHRLVSPPHAVPHERAGYLIGNSLTTTKTERRPAAAK